LGFVSKPHLSNAAIAGVSTERLRPRASTILREIDARRRVRWGRRI